MLNKIFLQGRLVADPELRHTQSGIPVASFRIAVDRDFKNQNGEKEAEICIHGELLKKKNRKKDNIRGCEKGSIPIQFPCFTASTSLFMARIPQQFG